MLSHKNKFYTRARENPNCGKRHQASTNSMLHNNMLHVLMHQAIRFVLFKTFNRIVSLPNWMVCS